MLELEILADRVLEDRTFIAGLHTTLSTTTTGLNSNSNSSAKTNANANANASALCAANADDELSITGRCSCTVGALSGDVHDTSPCDGKNNTYSCVRFLDTRGNEVGTGAGTGTGTGRNEMYCEFNDPEHYVEYYDLNADPYNLHNLYPALKNSTAGKAKLAALHARLLDHQACSGPNCFDPPALLR
jgi:hypothetical protein